RRPAQADLQSEVAMAVGPASIARPAPAVDRRAPPRRVLERGGALSWIMLAPRALFLLAFVPPPLLSRLPLSLQDRPVAKPGLFVGPANFVNLAHDAVFWQVTRNTFLYVAVTTVLKLLGGLGMALVMNQAFRARNIVRALLLLPFIVPTILSTIAW